MIKRAVIVDKSILAVNMYRLLLTPIITTFLIAKKFEEASPWFTKYDKIDLVIFNSNIFGKKLEEYLRRFSDEKVFFGMPKIFICKKGEDGFRKRIMKLPSAYVMERPFRPDDFFALVKRLIQKELN